MTKADSHHPPLPRLTLNISITGHRATRMPEGAVDAIAPVVDEVFSALQSAAQTLHDAAGSLFAAEAPNIRLHTPLATGADQIAADAAKRAGFWIRAVLPFPHNEYAKDFAEGAERESFGRHVAQADTVFSLPCNREDGVEAYVSVGRAVVAAADVLVAIWDGKREAGAGGTGQVVRMAQERGVPVIHIHVPEEGDTPDEIALIRGGRRTPLTEQAQYDTLVASVLGPPDDVEAVELADYFEEAEKLFNPRIEYPLLLALTGVKKLNSGAWRQMPVAEDAAQEWQHARDNTADAGPEFQHGLGALEMAYAWANGLAIRYAQLFRSGHVTNYALSALAVILALSGLIVPAIKFQLVITELVVIGLLFYNTRAGKKGEWHRRWLQYRHLAETLRPLPYLKRTGIGAAPFNDELDAEGKRTDAGTKWTRWYAGAVWRQMHGPSGTMTHSQVRSLAETMVRDQVKPQADYHHVNAHRMHHLDHQLHIIGNTMMWSVIITCCVFLVGYTFFHEWTVENTAWFVFVTAGFPAIGAAVFGIRGHGEYQLAASRSANTADALTVSAARLEQCERLEPLAEELERAAETMLADLGEWTLAYKERSLEIPA